MSSDVGHYELYFAVDGGCDENTLDQYRRTVQNELKELDGVDRIAQISKGEPHEGARSDTLVEIGALAFALKQSGAFDAVVQILKSWIESGNRRREKRKVIIKRPDGTVIEFDSYSLKEIGAIDRLPRADD
jgi:hypothetical protein